MEKQKRYPKGHFMGIGIALGVPLGVPIWLSTGNPGMIGAGIAIGVAIGAAMEGKYNKNPRPLTAREKKNKKRALLLGILLLITGALAFLLMLL